ncbi:MAG: flagellar hook-length control protein FliK, partial [Desulfobacteraceae bacterium]|nr:flagellar hook-length control protein FliK [Desulfobacteraceae bacterium]
PRLFDKSGILFEQKLAYLLKQGKGQPLRHEILNILKNDIKGYVLNQLQSSGHQSAGNLKAFSEYSANIENFQTLNAQSSDTGKYLIPFPVFANDSFSFGQLFIDLGNYEEEKKQDKKNRIINISFLLNMSELGALRADFSIYKKAISGVFNLSSMEICDFVKKNLFQLKNRLAKIEYLVHSIECRVASQGDISPTSFIESFTKDENRILNIII